MLHVHQWRQCKEMMMKTVAFPTHSYTHADRGADYNDSSNEQSILNCWLSAHTKQMRNQSAQEITTPINAHNGKFSVLNETTKNVDCGDDDVDMKAKDHEKEKHRTTIGAAHTDPLTICILARMCDVFTVFVHSFFSSVVCFITPWSDRTQEPSTQNASKIHTKKNTHKAFVMEYSKCSCPHFSARFFSLHTSFLSDFYVSFVSLSVCRVFFSRFALFCVRFFFLSRSECFCGVGVS